MDDGYDNFVLLVACLLFSLFNINCKCQTEYKPTLCHVIENDRLLLNQHTVHSAHTMANNSILRAVNITEIFRKY